MGISRKTPVYGSVTPKYNLLDKINEKNTEISTLVHELGTLAGFNNLVHEFTGNTSKVHRSGLCRRLVLWIAGATLQ